MKFFFWMKAILGVKKLSFFGVNIFHFGCHCRIQYHFLGFNGFQNTKATFHLYTSQPIHKKCPSMQWQGQLLLRPEEYFPWELPGEEDCDGSGQERRNTSNLHSSIRMEDTLLARSLCHSTSLQQLVKHCIYLMYLFQIQFSVRGLVWLAAATGAAAAQKLHDLSI